MTKLKTTARKFTIKYAQALTQTMPSVFNNDVDVKIPKPPKFPIEFADVVKDAPKAQNLPESPPENRSNFPTYNPSALEEDDSVRNEQERKFNRDLGVLYHVIDRLNLDDYHIVGFAQADMWREKLIMAQDQEELDKIKKEVKQAILEARVYAVNFLKDDRNSEADRSHAVKYFYKMKNLLEYLDR